MSQHNLVQTALGAQTVSLVDFDSAQILELLDAVLTRIKPSLADMANMRRLDGEIYVATKFTWDDMQRAGTDMLFATGINASTRCMHLLTHYCSEPDEACLDVRSILLLWTGTLVFVNFRADRIVGGMHPRSLTVMPAEPNLLSCVLSPQRLEILLLTLIGRFDEHLRRSEEKFLKARGMNTFLHQLRIRLGLDLRVG